MSAAPVPGPVFRTRDFSRLVTFSACSGLLVQRSWLYSGFDSLFSKGSHSVFFWPRPTLCAKKLGHCASCCVGGAGFGREVSLELCNRLRPSWRPMTSNACGGSSAPLPAAVSGSLHGFARVFHLLQGKGVRTGGRPHPGPAGERLLKQRPKLSLALVLEALLTDGAFAKMRTWFLAGRY